MGKNRAEIGITDTAAEVDLFGIERYIDGLYEFIDECTSPMTIAIQGDWGTGKTSIMKMVQNKLKSKYIDNTVWFNTWQFSQFDMGNSLAFSMMTVLMKELGCEKSSFQKFMGIIGGVAKKGVVAVTDKALGGTTAGMVDNFLTSDNVSDLADAVTELRKSFQTAINNKIEGKSYDKIVVFVDDLDRLQPQRAVELLEVMKLFLDCEHCVFVLAIDYNVVIRGVREKYGQDFDEEKGKSFFDKIIQVPFRMPVSSYDIQDYVKNSMGQIGMDINEKDIVHYVDLIENSIGDNPRGMKRLFNSFLLLKKIADEDIYADSTQRLMLFALLCMQTRFSEMYDTLLRMEDDEVERFISELGSDTMSCLQETGMVEDEQKQFIDFTEKLGEFIGADSKGDFKKVLGFSKITANDNGGNISQKRGSRIVEEGDFQLEYKTAEATRELYQFIVANSSGARLERVENNNGFTHIVGRNGETGKKFVDLNGRKNGFSVDCYVPDKKYYEQPQKNETIREVFEQFGVQKKQIHGKYLSITVLENETEKQKLLGEMIRLCDELNSK